MLRRFRRWLAGHISVDSRRAGAVLTFYDDGSATTECCKGFLLTGDQNAVLQDFIADQMGETLDRFERTRRLVEAEKVVVMPMSPGVN